MSIDKQKLRDAASKATQPSPWSAHECFSIEDGHSSRDIVVRDRDGMWVVRCGDDDENAAFIAAASPSAVLALLAENERLRKLANELLEWARPFRGPMPPDSVSETKPTMTRIAGRERDERLWAIGKELNDE